MELPNNMKMIQVGFMSLFYRTSHPNCSLQEDLLLRQVMGSNDLSPETKAEIESAYQALQLYYEGSSTDLTNQPGPPALIYKILNELGWTPSEYIVGPSQLFQKLFRTLRLPNLIEAGSEKYSTPPESVLTLYCLRNTPSYPSLEELLSQKLYVRNGGLKIHKLLVMALDEGQKIQEGVKGVVPTTVLQDSRVTGESPGLKFRLTDVICKDDQRLYTAFMYRPDNVNGGFCWFFYDPNAVLCHQMTPLPQLEQRIVHSPAPRPNETEDPMYACLLTKSVIFIFRPVAMGEVDNRQSGDSDPSAGTGNVDAGTSGSRDLAPAHLVRPGNVVRSSSTSRRENFGGYPDQFSANQEVYQSTGLSAQGIQGYNNSCHMDTLLFCLLYHADPYFVPILTTPSVTSDQTVKRVCARLSNIANQLRNPLYYCHHSRIQSLAQILLEFNPKLDGQMMDVQEFLVTLFRQGLRLAPFIQYTKGAQNYFHQIILRPTRSDKIFLGNLNHLLRLSLEHQGAKFMEIPMPAFFIKMPRSNGQLVGFHHLHPPLRMNLAGMIEGHSFHDDASVDLYAVICLQHHHYTAFLRDQTSPNDKWIYFDSMTHTGPRVSPVPGLEEELQRLEMLSGRPIHDIQDCLNSNPMLKRLVRDNHVCIYVPKGSINFSGSSTQSRPGAIQDPLARISVPRQSMSGIHTFGTTAPQSVERTPDTRVAFPSGSPLNKPQRFVAMDQRQELRLLCQLDIVLKTVFYETSAFDSRLLPSNFDPNSCFQPEESQASHMRNDCLARLAAAIRNENVLPRLDLQNMDFLLAPQRPCDLEELYQTLFKYKLHLKTFIQFRVDERDFVYQLVHRRNGPRYTTTHDLFNECLRHQGQSLLKAPNPALILKMPPANLATVGRGSAQGSIMGVLPSRKIQFKTQENGGTMVRMDLHTLILKGSDYYTVLIRRRGPMRRHQEGVPQEGEVWCRFMYNFESEEEEDGPYPPKISETNQLSRQLLDAQKQVVTSGGESCGHQSVLAHNHYMSIYVPATQSTQKKISTSGHPESPKLYSRTNPYGYP